MATLGANRHGRVSRIRTVRDNQVYKTTIEGCLIGCDAETKLNGRYSLGDNKVVLLNALRKEPRQPFDSAQTRLSTSAHTGG